MSRIVFLIGLLGLFQPSLVHSEVLPDQKSLENGDRFFDGSSIRRIPLGPLDLPLVPRPAATVPGQLAPARSYPLSDNSRRMRERFAVPIYRQEVSSSGFLGEGLGQLVEGSFRPIYSVAEFLTDCMYDVIRLKFMRRILHRNIREDLSGAPDKDSFHIYERKFNERENDYLSWLHGNYPHTGALEAGGRPDVQRLDKWKADAARRQLNVFLDSYQDTLLERYQLEKFGRSFGKYGRDNWEGDLIYDAQAAVVVSAMLFLSGLRTGWFDVYETGMKMNLDLNAVNKLATALEKENGTLDRIGSVRLGYKDNPITFKAQWGLHKETRYGLEYYKRF